MDRLLPALISGCISALSGMTTPILMKHLILTLCSLLAISASHAAESNLVPAAPKPGP